MPVACRRYLFGRSGGERAVDPLEDEHLPLFSVGQVAAMLEVKEAFLRRVDSLRVVSPSRSEGGQRRYTRHEVRVIRQVVIMADEGMTLPAIRRIIELERRLAAILAERDQLARRVRDLEARVGRDATSRGPGAGGETVGLGEIRD
jgi:MerR family transcriptional regulator, heat shock protein HspR